MYNALMSKNILTGALEDISFYCAQANNLRDGDTCPDPANADLVKNPPHVDYFKPRGVPMSRLTEVYLPVEGYEALRLAEVEGLGHQEAAERMNISRHTFGRVLAEARRIVAEAVVHGLALHIAGGDYALAEERPAAQPQPMEADMGKKIAISSEGPGLDDLLDPRFGRAAGFFIYDPETKETDYLNNGASQARAQGAGIQAAEMVAGAGVGVVLTGFVGPNAFQALNAVGIQVGQDLQGITVQRGPGPIPGRPGEDSQPTQPGGRRTVKLAVASGKGGTGKTTVSASLVNIWPGPVGAVDLDVEEPNLHLLLHPEMTGSYRAYMEVPKLIEERCTSCGACSEICQFKAVSLLGMCWWYFRRCATAAVAAWRFARKGPWWSAPVNWAKCPGVPPVRPLSTRVCCGWARP
jgi:predicted DNA-binding protein (UPF0251 family)/predicted Fe-Mo cluster-binding NifX family protein